MVKAMLIGIPDELEVIEEEMEVKKKGRMPRHTQ